MALSKVAAPGRALIGRPPASVRSGWGHALLRDRSGADQAVFRLEEHLEIGRNVVRDQRRNADAEVHEVAGT
jgi:hypothetical protein